MGCACCGGYICMQLSKWQISKQENISYDSYVMLMNEHIMISCCVHFFFISLFYFNFTFSDIEKKFDLRKNYISSFILYCCLPWFARRIVLWQCRTFLTITFDVSLLLYIFSSFSWFCSIGVHVCTVPCNSAFGHKDSQLNQITLTFQSII